MPTLGAEILIPTFKCFPYKMFSITQCIHCSWKSIAIKFPQEKKISTEDHQKSLQLIGNCFFLKMAFCFVKSLRAMVTLCVLRAITKEVGNCLL